jgi:hypothetical protein
MTSAETVALQTYEAAPANTAGITNCLDKRAIAQQTFKHSDRAELSDYFI